MEQLLRRRLRVGISIAAVVVILAALAAAFFLPYPVTTESRAATLTVSKECYRAGTSGFGDTWQQKVVTVTSLEAGKSYEGRLSVRRDGLIFRRNHSGPATFTLQSGEEISLYPGSKTFWTMECSMRPGEMLSLP